MSVQAVESNGLMFQKPELPKGLFNLIQPTLLNVGAATKRQLLSMFPYWNDDGSYAPKVEVRYKGQRTLLQASIDVHTVSVTKGPWYQTVSDSQTKFDIPTRSLSGTVFGFPTKRPVGAPYLFCGLQIFMF